MSAQRLRFAFGALLLGSVTSVAGLTMGCGLFSRDRSSSSASTTLARGGYATPTVSRASSSDVDRARYDHPRSGSRAGGPREVVVPAAVVEEGAPTGAAPAEPAEHGERRSRGRRFGARGARGSGSSARPTAPRAENDTDDLGGFQLGLSWMSRDIELGPDGIEDCADGGFCTVKSSLRGFAVTLGGYKVWRLFGPAVLGVRGSAEFGFSRVGDAIFLGPAVRAELLAGIEWRALQVLAGSGLGYDGVFGDVTADGAYSYSGAAGIFSLSATYVRPEAANVGLRFTHVGAGATQQDLLTLVLEI